MKQRRNLTRRALLKAGAYMGGAVAGASALTACGAVKLMPTLTAAQSQPKPVQTTAPVQPEPTAQPQGQGAGQQGMPYRAMWVSYLEWENADFSSELAFTAYITTLCQRCAALGLDTLLVQVRPFGDALYQSAYYPWSHCITGIQGQAPGFDPLVIIIEQAHAAALRVEAWVNPYRLRLHAQKPETLAEQNLYYTKPDWVVTVGEGLYLNPALQETADYVCQGVQEIIENYAVDGIHFDDYFYPSTEDAIDEAQFAASNETDRTAFRLGKVSALVQQVYQCIKAYDETLTFGISPQGNPDNNKNQQYSDVFYWMNPAAGEAFVDYICPQVYWGYHYTLQSGSTRFSFENITAEWLAQPRAQNVALYFGLGAYRIGDGDSGQNEDSTTQWNTGEALAGMITDLTARGANGYALYRYDSLYASAYQALAQAECAAITAVNQEA